MGGEAYKMTTAIVIPTNRPEEFLEWLEDFTKNYEEQPIIVCWDGENKEELLELVPEEQQKYLTKVFDWTDREPYKEFIPRKSDTIRSLGFLYAYRKGWNVWTLDDDTRIPEDSDPLFAYEMAECYDGDITGYYDVGQHVKPAMEKMRGYPYQGRKADIGVQYGGWHKVPDFDALKQVENIESGHYWFEEGVYPVPKGLAVTGCIMNCYIPHRWIPAMYQLLQGEEYGVDRYGDIWSGLFMKKVADQVGEVVVINGDASVNHVRKSNPWAALKKEAQGLEANETLWSEINVDLTGVFVDNRSTISEYYEAVAQLVEWTEFPGLPGYNEKLGEAMRKWLDHCEVEELTWPKEIIWPEEEGIAKCN